VRHLGRWRLDPGLTRNDPSDQPARLPSDSAPRRHRPGTSTKPWTPRSSWPPTTTARSFGVRRATSESPGARPTTGVGEERLRRRNARGRAAPGRRRRAAALGGGIPLPVRRQRSLPLRCADRKWRHRGRAAAAAAGDVDDLRQIGNESVPKIIINDTKIYFLNCNQHFCSFKL